MEQSVYLKLQAARYEVESLFLPPKRCEKKPDMRKLVFMAQLYGNMSREK